MELARKGETRQHRSTDQGHRRDFARAFELKMTVTSKRGFGCVVASGSSMKDYGEKKICRAHRRWRRNACASAARGCQEGVALSTQSEPWRQCSGLAWRGKLHAEQEHGGRQGLSTRMGSASCTCGCRQRKKRHRSRWRGLGRRASRSLR